MQSSASRPSAYAAAFSREAAQRRATLDVADRIELEDLVADLSTNGEELDKEPGLEAFFDRPPLLSTTRSKRVEIEYVVDHGPRIIRVISLRRGGETSDASLNEAGHG